MHFKVPHQTSQAEAITKLRRALHDAQGQIPKDVSIDRQEWNNNVLTFAVTVQGKEITGSLTVTETELEIDAKLPLLWRLFEGKIESMIAEQLKSLPRR